MRSIKTRSAGKTRSLPAHAPAGPQSTPRYQLVKDEIVASIAQGKWASGSKLPSENMLVSQTGLSRMTVHRAMRELAADGVISRYKGIGSFVSPQSPKSELLFLRDMAEDVPQHGRSHRAVTVVLEEIRADIDLAMAFEKSVGTRLYHSVIVNLEGTVPIQLEERFVSPAFAPDYLQQDFTRITPGRYLRSLGAVTEVEHMIYAGLAEARAQELLQMDACEACLYLMRRTWMGAVPATRSTFTYPGNRYSLSSRYKLSGDE